MIPILYAHNETQFLSNGIGRLSDCISCVVTEERNGIFECEFVYPITGEHYDDISEGKYIYCTHDETQVPQPFEIYGHSAPIDGKVTFYAQHISYKLNKMVAMPFTATSITEAMGQLSGKCVTSCPFTFWTDKDTVANFRLPEPRSIRAILGGQEGSFLDVFGTGEYEWDMFSVKLHLHRGSDSGVEIRYGKNLVDLTDDIDVGSAYNAVVPFWLPNDEESTEESTMVVLPEKMVVYNDGEFVDPTDPDTVITGVAALDCSSDYENQPTEAQLRSKAQNKLRTSKAWEGTRTTEVNFVALWQTDEYKDVAPLQRVKLCDTVSVYYPELGVEAVKQKVVRTVYNVLLDRYDELELGDAHYSYSDILTEGLLDDIPSTSFVEAAVSRATNLITGNKGGYVRLNLNADGQPEEILIMDDEDIDDALKIWRWNMGGLGYSSTGYNGTYGTAITMDGSIVADYITTGTLNAARVNAGTLQDRTGTNLWNLDTGEFRLTPNAKVKVGNTDSSLSTYVGSVADDAIDDYDEDLNQTAIYNKLTNNSQNEGIYLSNGHLYLNASLINTGTLSADRIRTGILQDDTGTNFWNLSTGEFQLTPNTTIRKAESRGSDFWESGAWGTDGVETVSSARLRSIRFPSNVMSLTAVHNYSFVIGAWVGDTYQGYLKSNGNIEQGTSNIAWVTEFDVDEYRERYPTYEYRAMVRYTPSPSTAIDFDEATSSVTIVTHDTMDNYVDDAVDLDLTQEEVYDILTNNSQNEGIFLSNGHLYLNASMMNTGQLNAGLIKAGILQDSAGKNFWNMVTGEFQLTSGSKVTDGSGTVMTIEDYIEGLADQNLTQQEIYDILTDDSNNEGIYLYQGRLYLNASMMNTGSLSANLITAGVLQSQDNDESFYLNLATGQMRMEKGSIELGDAQNTDYYFNVNTNGRFQWSSKYSSMTNEGQLTIERGSIKLGYISASDSYSFIVNNSGVLTTQRGDYKITMSNGSVSFYYDDELAGGIGAEYLPGDISSPGPFITIGEDAGGGGFIINRPPGSNMRQVAFFYDRDNDTWKIDRGFTVNCDTEFYGDIDAHGYLKVNGNDVVTTDQAGTLFISKLHGTDLNDCTLTDCSLYPSKIDLSDSMWVDYNGNSFIGYTGTFTAGGKTWTYHCGVLVSVS